MAKGIEPTLYTDPQTLPSKACPRCGGAVYPPGYGCIRCQRGGGMTLSELSGEYRAAADTVRLQLRRLRRQAEAEEDPEVLWHLRYRIFKLTKILTQMNELAELTERYYERGYYRSEKYTL